MCSSWTSSGNSEKRLKGNGGSFQHSRWPMMLNFFHPLQSNTIFPALGPDCQMRGERAYLQRSLPFRVRSTRSHCPHLKALFGGSGTGSEDEDDDGIGSEEASGMPGCHCVAPNDEDVSMLDDRCSIGSGGLRGKACEKVMMGSDGCSCPASHSWYVSSSS